MDKGEYGYYLELLKKSKKNNVRLLGGEPFLHPQIEYFIEQVLNDDYFTNLTIFTSGFIDPKIIRLLAHDKVNLVINVNHPDDYPKGRFPVLEKSIARLADAPVRLTIGYNIYQPDFDYAPVLSLAKRMGCKTLRWTIAVPSADTETACLSMDEKRSISGRIIEFVENCINNHIEPVLDCPFEPCVLTGEDSNRFARLCPQAYGELGMCSPVIDLCPGYKVIRCFASGNRFACDVRNFSEINEIVDHFTKTIDSIRYYIAPSACHDCFYMLKGRCYGGCIAENIIELEKLARTRDELPGILEDCERLYKSNKHEDALVLLKKHIDDTSLPELIIEYASAQLGNNDVPAFLEHMEKYESFIRSSGIPSANYLLAKYLEIKGDYEGACGMLRRCMFNISEEKKDAIREMIAGLEMRN